MEAVSWKERPISLGERALVAFGVFGFMACMLWFMAIVLNPVMKKITNYMRPPPYEVSVSVSSPRFEAIEYRRLLSTDMELSRTSKSFGP